MPFNRLRVIMIFYGQKSRYDRQLLVKVELLKELPCQNRTALWSRTACYPSMNHSLSHEFRREWVSEQANEWVQRSTRARQASEWVSGVSQQVNRWARGSVFTYGILSVLGHSGLLFFKKLNNYRLSPRSNPYRLFFAFHLVLLLVFEIDWIMFLAIFHHSVRMRQMNCTFLRLSLYFLDLVLFNGRLFHMLH